MSHCKFFKGDRPCKYYWIDRSWDCNNCEHHTTYDKRLLLIKLDELGDVVRSTALVNSSDLSMVAPTQRVRSGLPQAAANQ